MKIIGADMLKCFPMATKTEPLSESDGLKYPYTSDDFHFDKERHCYLVNGGEVYLHSCPSGECGGRPNGCEHCMYAGTARFYSTKLNGKKCLVMTCRGLYMCKAVSRLYKEHLVGRSLFFKDTIYYKTHESDNVHAEMVNP